MQGDTCRYCLNQFTLQNEPLMIKCSHCLCKKCITFLNENSQDICFWCKKDVSYNPEGLRVHQISYNQLLNRKNKLCRNHSRIFTHISKLTLAEYCDRCLQEGNINTTEIEDIRNKESIIQIYTDEKAQIVTNLIKAYEEKLNAVNRVEEFYTKIDNAKKIHEALVGEIEQETLIDKIALIKNFNLFKFLEDTDLEDKLANLDKDKSETSYMLAVSPAGISREKRLINWNDDNGVWLGNILSRVKVESGGTSVEFTFQGDSPLRIVSVGLGMSYSQGSFLYYYGMSFSEVGGGRKEFLLEKNVDKIDNRITTEFNLGTEGYILNPRKKYVFDANYEGLNFYAVVGDSNVTFRQKTIIQFQNTSKLSMICYMKFN